MWNVFTLKGEFWLETVRVEGVGLVVYEGSWYLDLNTFFSIKEASRFSCDEVKAAVHFWLLCEPKIIHSNSIKKVQRRKIELFKNSVIAAQPYTELRNSYSYGL